MPLSRPSPPSPALLCVTVTAPTTAELRRRRDAISDADLVELRLDTVADIDVAGALAGRTRPAIVTCRPRWEGGSFGGSEEERRRILAQAQALGAEYIDVEWRARFDDLIRQDAGRGVVLSRHDAAEAPGDLASIYREMRASGAEVVKLAVAAGRLADLIPLLDLAPSEPTVLIGLGPRGLASRVLASRFGCRWTYAGELEAAGQLTVTRMLGEFRFRHVHDAIGVYAVVGAPVLHSLSPAMHNAAFHAAGLDAVYVPLEAADASDFLAFARAIGLKGASVTAPFKMDLFRQLDEVDPLGARLGAINTLRVEAGRLAGMNTDVPGFLEPLAGRLDLAGVRAAILGAGGAARAVAVALGSCGARVAVYARDPDRAAAVAALAGGSGHGWPPPRGSWDLLVNATPIGTCPSVEQTPLAADALDGRFVYDLVYNPPVTRLLREAQAAGCETLNGLPMLVAQARRQFEWWTGRSVPETVMAEAACRRLGRGSTRL